MGAYLINCWEAMHCGREPGGERAEELGVCLAATVTALDGVHGGKNGGRACWSVAGTTCHAATGVFALRLEDCKICPFYERVLHEQGTSLLEDSVLCAMARPQPPTIQAQSAQR